MCRSGAHKGDIVTGIADTRLLDELSQQFLRAVSLTCGSEVGTEAAKALEPILGKAWKDRLIIHKLSGTYQLASSISIILVDDEVYRNYGSNAATMKIRAIKEIRAMTGFGLVQAKGFVETAEHERQVAQLSNFQRDENPKAWEMKMLASIDVLRQCGFEVNYA